MIHYLAQKCFTAALSNKTIVNLKRDSSLEGSCGMAPVHFAARYGANTSDTLQTVEMLMKSMEDPFQRDEFGNTVLHYAILNGNTDVVTDLQGQPKTVNLR